MYFKLFHRCSLLVLVFVGLTNITFGQSSFENSKFIPRSFEVTASFSNLQIFRNDASTDRLISQGYGLRAGYRPDFASRRLLVEAYLLHIPKSEDPLEPAPQISSLGVSGNYLLLNPKFRINPFLGLGLGTYSIDDIDPNTTPESSTNNEPFYEDENMAALSINSGFYVSILPKLLLRADIQLYNPIGSDFKNLENTTSKFAFSAGLSFRF